MKPIAITACIVITLALCITVKATNVVNPSVKAMVARNLSTMSVAFTENKGQWPDSILYRANTGGATVWFTSNGVYYQFTRRVLGTNRLVTGPDFLTDRAQMQEHEIERDSTETMMIKASFVGCNPNPLILGENRLRYKYNYLLGTDQSKWRTDVPNYTSIIYREVYPGIDMKYYGNGCQLEYEFAISPGADCSKINIQYEGAKCVSVSGGGNLTIEMKWGSVTEKAPRAFQVGVAKQAALAVEYRVLDNLSFGFQLRADYDPSAPMLVDPTIVFGTFLGGDQDDHVYAVAVDRSGCAYLAGGTASANFPITNSLDTVLGGSSDVFVTKLSADGGSLEYSTFFGGDKYDESRDIAVDALGAAYVIGETISTDFPISTGFDPSFNGAVYDVFVVKLVPSGNNLEFSSYLGGVGDDLGYGIAVDSIGCSYLTGYTESHDFPIVAAFDSTFDDPFRDGFIAKVSSDGDRLIYCSFVGGNNADYSVAIAVDQFGCAYLTGWTYSSDFPTLSAFDSAWNNSSDAFVAKVGPAGSSLVYSTFIGGTLADHGYSIDLDHVCDAYITGLTYSTDYPTMNSFDQSYNGQQDAFVTKLNPAGNNLLYSSYLGGTRDEFGYGISVDESGGAFITGFTSSPNLPVSPTVGGQLLGSTDAFLTKVAPAGTKWVYSTYLGGSLGDWGFGVTAKSEDTAFVAGWTTSSDFPMANGPGDSLHGAVEAFIVKLALPNCCNNITGNVDCDSGDGTDISDLSALIDYLYISFTPLCCPAEANTDGQPGIDISDLSALIDYLYISFTPPAACQ